MRFETGLVAVMAFLTVSILALILVSDETAAGPGMTSDSAASSPGFPNEGEMDSGMSHEDPTASTGGT